MTQLSETPNNNDDVIITNKWRRILTGYLIVLIIGLIVSLSSIWPTIDKPIQAEAIKDSSITKDSVIARDTVVMIDLNKLDSLLTKFSDSLKTLKTKPNKISYKDLDEKKMWLIVLLVGALGACLHGLVSLGEFTGNREFNTNWVSWYAMRPFVGGVLALLFFFLTRGGFVGEANNETNFYGIIALAGLIGLFSKQALYKLSDIADTLLASNKEKKLKDKLTDSGNSTPKIKSVTPQSILKGFQQQQFIISGSNFMDGATVKIGKTNIKPDSVQVTEITFTLKSSDLTAIADFNIQVVNPNKKLSGPVLIKVEPSETDK